MRIGRAASAGFMLAGVALVGGGGCTGYQLGDPGTLPFASIHVAPPVNSSLAPQAAALVGTSLTHALDRSGRVSIAPESAADAVLNVTLVDYHREITAERASDTRLARKWRVTLTATCTLLNRREDEPWFAQREVSAFDEVYGDSGLVPAEYQNMPVLADRLAQEIAREVLGVW